MVQVRLDDVTRSQIVDGADASGTPIYSRTLTVHYTVLSDPPVSVSNGYHAKQFANMTRDQIRAFILADIKASLGTATSPNDASTSANITPGETVTL